MSTPDMSDVARPANTDARNALINLIAKHIAAADLDQLVSWTGPNDVTSEQLRYAGELLTAIHKAAGYALVRLPEPDRVDLAAAEGDWSASEGRVFSYVNADGFPYVDTEGYYGNADDASAYAARVLAAARWAREQADEHNTAAQDAEEGGTDG